MKKMFLVTLLVLVFAAGAYMMVVQRYGCPFRKKSSVASFELKTNMRKLWEDHITWTRNYIISALAGLEDLSAVTERLLQNQVDLGNAIKPVYGQEAGDQLAALLKDHILIAAQVVTAAKKNAGPELQEASKKWTENADAMAEFLSKANPYAPKKVMQDFLHKHLELTTGEVTSRLKKDWKSDIEFYDKGHEHMLMFSDALAGAIVKQFPDKF
jgi:hypothetical protein